MGACKCGTRDAWRVWTRLGNYSAFNGYHFTPSDYSQVACEREQGGCGRVWRTKAAYVATLPDSETVGVERRQVESGGKGTRSVIADPSVGRPDRLLAYRPPLKCADCGQPGGPLLGPLTAGRYGRIFHRDGCEA